MKSLLLAVLALTTLQPTFACNEDGSEGFVPTNNMKIEVGAKRAGGLTEEQFNSVIDKVEVLYAPIIAQEGGKLVVNRGWTDATVNASAGQYGTTWNVNMFGGLARHETITEDGFALVICHEIGHHIGGAPIKVSGWASNEGQADYFANLKCLRRVFLNENNMMIVRQMKNVPESLKNACKTAWATAADRAICIRGGMAGDSVARLFAALRSAAPAKFETPDTKVVTRTNDSHPAHQCRLDTYLQGSICEVDMNENVADASEVTGTCHASLGHKIGLRPTCWFKPKAK